MNSLSVFLLLLLPCFAFAQVQSKAELPSPTGTFGIGRTVFHWTDNSRQEIATSEVRDHRELLVYLFYPVDKNARGQQAIYFPHLKEIEAFEERFGKDSFRQGYGESYPSLSNIRTHTLGNAQISAKNRRYPIVVFSHGGGVPVLFYTAIIEDLVSHGYAVAAIEHSYDGATTVFPDGHIITQSGWDKDAERTPEERRAFHTLRIKVGAEDDSFVLSQLEKLNKGMLTNASKQFRGRFDMTRVGATGHSLGGKIAITACQQDKRLKFCLNLDGGLDAGATYDTVTQPVVGMYGYRKMVQKPNEAEADFLKRKASMEKNIDNLKAQYAGVPSASRLVLIDAPGFSHFSYYDFPTAQTELAPWHATPEQWSRNKQIILAFTVAAFDAQLRSRQHRESLASLPLTQYPEVRLDTLGVWKKANSSWQLERTINQSKRF
jgi:dienelactone hydrolase